MGRQLIEFDTKILALCTRVCHAIQRYTGRTNYFLAKLTVVLSIASLAVKIWNYWIPVLGRQASSAETAISGVFILLMSLDAYLCDAAEGTTLGETRSKPAFLQIFSDPIVRISALLFFGSIGGIFLLIFWKMGGGSFFVVLDRLFPFTLVFYVYFMAVDPLPPGKSKIWEWLEVFLMGFQKLAETRIKR